MKKINILNLYLMIACAIIAIISGWMIIDVSKCAKMYPKDFNNDLDKIPGHFLVCILSLGLCVYYMTHLKKEKTESESFNYC